MSDRADFARAVRGASAPDPYAMIHSARVVVQREDGTLDLHFEEGPFAGGDNDPLAVPFEPGLNCAMKFMGGELVRVAFAGGRPDGIFAFGRIHNPSASKAVVRVGDHGNGGTLTGSTPPGGGAVTFVYTDPDGVPHTSLSISLVFKASEGSGELKIP